MAHKILNIINVVTITGKKGLCYITELLEIENEEVMVTLCDNCLQARCDDI